MIIRGLMDGFNDETPKVEALLKGLTTKIQNQLKAAAGLVNQARDIGSSIMSALAPQLSGPDSDAGMSTLDLLKKQMNDTAALGSGIAKLASEHLNKSFLTQLVNGGTSSLGAINDLLAGGQGSVNLANQYSSGIGSSSRSIANAEAMRQTGVQLGKNGNTVLAVTVQGSVLSEHDLIKTLQKAVRNGGGLKALFGSN